MRYSRYIAAVRQRENRAQVKETARAILSARIQRISVKGLVYTDPKTGLTRMVEQSREVSHE